MHNVNEILLSHSQYENYNSFVNSLFCAHLVIMLNIGKYYKIFLDQEKITYQIVKSDQL